MGQGTESCGGYEIPYEPHNEALQEGLWVTPTGEIHISEMSVRHLQHAIRIAKAKSECATFSCEAEDWEEIADALQEELSNRGEVSRTAVYVDPSVKRPQRGLKLTMVCHCGKTYEVRVADVKRVMVKAAVNDVHRLNANTVDLILNVR